MENVMMPMSLFVIVDLDVFIKETADVMNAPPEKPASIGKVSKEILSCIGSNVLNLLIHIIILHIIADIAQ